MNYFHHKYNKNGLGLVNEIVGQMTDTEGLPQDQLMKNG